MKEDSRALSRLRHLYSLILGRQRFCQLASALEHGRRSTTPTAEALEPRLLLSVNPSLDSGAVRFVGDSAADTLYLSQTGGRLTWSLSN